MYHRAHFQKRWKGSSLPNLEKGQIGLPGILRVATDWVIPPVWTTRKAAFLDSNRSGLKCEGRALVEPMLQIGEHRPAGSQAGKPTFGEFLEQDSAQHHEEAQCSATSSGVLLHDWLLKASIRSCDQFRVWARTTGRSGSASTCLRTGLLDFKGNFRKGITTSVGASVYRSLCYRTRN